MGCRQWHVPMTKTRESLVEKFLSRFSVGQKEECWEWQGTKFITGYGKLDHYSNRVRLQLYAHRYSYSYFVGEIPKGLVIDHLCENRACINPNHLEPTTIVDNIQRTYDRKGLRRGHPGVRIRFIGGKCKYGHLLEGKNVTVCKNGVVRCGECGRKANRASYAHNKLKKGAY